MTLSQWLIFFLIIQLVHFITSWKLYQKAGRKAWEAAIPVYNTIVLMKIINRPTWWTILLFIPIINLIMIPVVWVETIRSFGKNTTTDTLLVLFTFGLYIAYINYTQNVTYIENRSLVATTKTGDTVSSLLFAIVVATLVHTYIMQPFTIPTSSLEKTLLVGDFLFVSKFHYGARTPMTAVALPMVHDSIPLTPKLADSIPFLNKASYSKWPQLPYFRFPGLQTIKNNDIVVFNWPGDTVFVFFDKSNRRAYKPIDKKSNYVKRCVGIPGDVISSKDGILYTNNKEVQYPDRAKIQASYFAEVTMPLDPSYLFKELHITDEFYPSNPPQGADPAGSYYYFSALTDESVARLKNNPAVKSITRIPAPASTSVFPHNRPDWSIDTFGPIYIPQAGKTIDLTSENIALYKRIITEYEGNKLQQNGDTILINGEAVKSYTFKQDYYWMMGDNRHRSEDSRYWGFVPENHIVGKPVFIWFSWETYAKGLDKIRWERLFTTVGGEGEPRSYFKFFLILLAAYFIGSHFYNKRKVKE
jgi:signal peptidase I